MTVRRWVLVGSGAVAAAVICTGVGLYLWAASYEPFTGVTGDGPRAGVVRFVDPAEGSDGRRVFFVRASKRGANAEFDLVAKPRWGVTVVGVARSRFPSNAPRVEPVSLLGWTYNAIPRPRRAHEFRVGTWNRVLVHYRTYCADDAHGSTMSVSQLTLRYRYLKWFERTQTIDLPAALTLTC